MAEPRCPESNARVSPARDQTSMPCWGCGKVLPFREVRPGDWALAEHTVDMSLPPPNEVVETAIDLANSSPCAKSKRGVVVWAPPGTLEQLLASGGHNSPPHPLTCDGSDECQASCGRLCEHAEMEALRDLLGLTHRSDLEMLHVKTVDGDLVPSGGPSCWQCSRSISRDQRIAAVWLFHEAGWRRYPTEEFHRLTLEVCGLPVIRGGR